MKAPKELEETLRIVKKSGVTVVSLPMVNEWTQDRDKEGRRSPQWRGLPPLLQLQQHQVPIAFASDNTRDQFYAYGDLDQLEVFQQAIRLGQLDRPYRNWPASVCNIPADAMHLRDHGRIAEEGDANLVLFKGRCFSELLARSQWNRMVIRKGKLVMQQPPDYEELDHDVSTQQYMDPWQSYILSSMDDIRLDEEHAHDFQS